MASRGETTGPRVTECRLALARWRLFKLFVDDFGMTAATAEETASKLSAEGLTPRQKTADAAAL